MTEASSLEQTQTTLLTSLCFTELASPRTLSRAYQSSSFVASAITFAWLDLVLRSPKTSGLRVHVSLYQWSQSASLRSHFALFQREQDNDRLVGR